MALHFLQLGFGKMLRKQTSSIILLLAAASATVGSDQLVCKHLTNPLTSIRSSRNMCQRGSNFFQPIPPDTKTTFILESRDYSKQDLTQADRRRGKRLIHLLRTEGYVHLFNHSIPQDTIVTAFNQSRQFVGLTESQKRNFMLLDRPDFKPITTDDLNPPHPDGVEDMFIPLNLREVIEVHQDTIATPMAALPHLFPSLRALEDEGQRVSREVLQLIAIGMGLEDVNAFAKVTQSFTHRSVTTMAKLSSFIYDPIRVGDVLPPNSMFLTPHIDFSIVSLVYQDETGGLEVANLKGTWDPVDPHPGSIALLPGNILQVLSGGLITPSLHRVPLPAGMRLRDGSYRILQKKAERQSIIHFVVSDDEVEMTPFKYPRITTKQYNDNVYNIASDIPNALYI